MTTPIDRTAVQVALANAVSTFATYADQQDALVGSLQATVATQQADITARDATIAELQAELAALQPFTGTLFGAALNTLDCSALEQPAGRPLGVHRLYAAASEVDKYVTQCGVDIAAGRVPWVSFKLPQPWLPMAAGGGDAWAQDVCAKLGKLPGPVMLTWHHEPEGDQSPISAWVNMHARLSAFSKPYPNIKCGPILSSYDEFYGPHDNPKLYGAYDLTDLYPDGFNGGDFVAFDVYNKYGSKQAGAKWWYYSAEYFGKIAAYANSQGVPWAIGEWGVSPKAAAYDQTQHGGQTMMRDAWDYASANGCLAMAYFSSNLNTSTSGVDWRLESDPVKLAAFVQLLKESPGAPAHW